MKLKLLVGLALLASLGAAHASYILIWRDNGEQRSIPGYQNEQVCKQAANQMGWDAFCIPGPDEKTPAPDMDMPAEDTRHPHRQ